MNILIGNRFDLITESKGYSEEVSNLSSQIIETMIYDFPNSKEYIAKDKTVTYREHEVVVNFGDDIKSILLRYTVYLFKSKEDYLSFIKYNDINLDCEYDSLTRIMTIVTCHYDGHFSEDLEESVHHETMHMFQYNRLMIKNEDLYNKVREYYEQGENNIDAYYVGLTLYYTFSHEQGAFIQQFFQFLKDNNYKNQSLDSYIEAIQSFQPYINFKNAVNVIREYHLNDNMQDAIKELGFDNKTYMTRINISFHKFKRKLKRAYFEHIRLMQESKLSMESKFRKFQKRLKLFEERKYDNVPSFKYENYYCF